MDVGVPERGIKNVLPERINVPVPNSTRRPETDRGLRVVRVHLHLGSLLSTRSRLLALPDTEKKLPEVLEGVRSLQTSLLIFNMLTTIRPLTRFFPICGTFKLPPCYPWEKKKKNWQRNSQRPRNHGRVSREKQNQGAGSGRRR